MYSTFDLSQFFPHGHCYLWRPDILWMNVASDALIFLSYMIIPMMLFLLIRRNPAMPNKWVLVTFASFIFFCGLTHLMAIVTVWAPVYYLQGGVKLVTAAISVATAILFVPVFPAAFRIVSEPDHVELYKTIERTAKSN